MSRPSSTMSRSTASVRAAPRRKSTQDDDFIYDCKAAYHVMFDDVEDEITSKDELAEVLQQSGRNPSRKTIYKYWKGKDISFQEFCDICAEIPKTSTDDLLKAFKKVDLNGDGYISNSELKRMLTSKGEKMTDSEVAAIIEEVDENGDGKLDYKEFCNLLLSTQEEVKKLGVEKLERKKRGKNSDWHISSKPPKPRPRPRPYKAIHDEDELSPRQRDQAGRASKSGAGHQRFKLPKPKSLEQWQVQKTKGCFLFDDDGTIVTHHYKLVLPEYSSVWVTIEPTEYDQYRDTPVDTVLYVLGRDHSLVTFTEQRDDKGKYGIRCDLEAGTYKLIPFTTGCHFRRRREDRDVGVKLVKKNKDGITLTKQFRDTLTEIFHLADLDDDGCLSREEFSLYNVRVSGEEVSDDEWAVVEENVELKGNKLTLEGFLKLNEMEAEDTEGDQEELWVTLSSWGYNKALQRDEACPFKMEVYAEDCNVALSVTELKAGGRALETAVIESTKRKGDTRKVKGVRDLFLHTYQTDFRACLVVENKSHNRVSLALDCSKSKNCISNRKRLSYTVDVPAKSVVVGLHLMPQDDEKDWTLNVQESID